MTLRNLLIATLILLTGYLCMPKFALALDEIGRIAVLEGNAFVYRDGEPVFKLSEEDKLYEGDMIETAPEAEAIIELADGTEMTLAGDSALRLIRHNYAKEGGRKNASMLELVHGSMLYLSGQVSKSGGTASIKTKYGSLGIRGTEFWAGERMTDNGKGLGVFVEDGEVEIRNWAGSALVKKGLGSHVYGFGTPPGKPRPWAKQARLATFDKLRSKRAGLKLRRQERIQKNIQKLRDNIQKRDIQKRDIQKRDGKMPNKKTPTKNNIKGKINHHPGRAHPHHRPKGH